MVREEVRCNYMFKTVSREQKVVTRLFQQEKAYDDKYAPRLDAIKTRNPCYSFRAGSHQPTLPESEHARDYQLCQKNPIRKWVHEKAAKHERAAKKTQSSFKKHSKSVNSSKVELNEVEHQSPQEKSTRLEPLKITAHDMNQYELETSAARKKVPLHIRFSRKSPRKSLIEKAQHTSEDYLNNFHSFQLNPSRIHHFTSSPGHDLYKGVIPNTLPSYNLLGVKYDRLVSPPSPYPPSSLASTSASSTSTSSSTRSTSSPTARKPPSSPSSTTTTTSPLAPTSSAARPST